MKPVASPFPDTINTLEDHIKTKRLDLGLFQKDVARQIGVTTCTITNWEKNHASPKLYLIPRVIDFLGYNPIEYVAKTLLLGDQLLRARKRIGMNQKDLARRLGVATNTVAYRESNRSQPSLQMIPRAIEFLGYDPVSVNSDSLSPGQQVVGARQRLGMTQNDLARQLGVHPTTLYYWEHDLRQPMPENRAMLEAFVGDEFGAVVHQGPYLDDDSRSVEVNSPSGSVQDWGNNPLELRSARTSPVRVKMSADDAPTPQLTFTYA